MASLNATSPHAAVPRRDATGRLRPRATGPGPVSKEAAETLEDAPVDVAPVMDEAFTESVLAITTHLFNRARRPPVPLPGPAWVAAPESMSMRECTDTAQLIEATGAVHSGVLAFRARFPTLTKTLFGAPPRARARVLGPDAPPDHWGRIPPVGPSHRLGV